MLELEGRANGAAEGKFEFAAVALGLLPALGVVVMFELGLCGVPVNDGAADPNSVVPSRLVEAFGLSWVATKVLTVEPLEKAE